MISDDVRARIRRLFFAEHWKIGTIAIELDVHRDTVARAVDTSRFATVKFRTKAQMLDPYREFVRATLGQYPRLCSTRLFEMIRERGYQGSVFPLRRVGRGNGVLREPVEVETLGIVTGPEASPESGHVDRQDVDCV